MSIEMSISQLPSGARCMLMVTAGHFSKEDAEEFFRQISPGAPMHRLPRLCLCQKQTSASSDARTMFVRLEGEEEPWTAMVVVSPVVRVAINFVLRISKNKKVRLFTDEREATRWLDERVQKDTARAGA
jgi:hypothetical protein